MELPWTIDLEKPDPDLAQSLKQFDESSSVRKEFNRDGHPDDDEMFSDSKGFMKHVKVTLQQAGLMFGTASQVTRWRLAHKEALERGEIEDCVSRMIRLTKEELEKDIDKERDWIEAGVAFVLLVIKKKGDQTQER